MKKNKTIDILNNLITINNDRIQGYTTAVNETEVLDLKALFSHFVTSSEKCREELILEVTALGGAVAQGTSTSGVFFRVWVYIKKNLFVKDRRTILISCEFGESLIQNAYAKILENKSAVLNEEHLNMIRFQNSLLEKDRHYLNSFNEVLLQA